MLKKIALALCAVALLVSTGCKNRCCNKQAISSSACCPASPPPGYLPPG